MAYEGFRQGLTLTRLGFGDWASGFRIQDSRFRDGFGWRIEGVRSHEERRWLFEEPTEIRISPRILYYRKIIAEFALQERCPPRQKSRLERLKAKVEPL